MKPKGYCPECGKPTYNVITRTYNIGLVIHDLTCSDCGIWEVQYKK